MICCHRVRSARGLLLSASKRGKSRRERAVRLDCEDALGSSALTGAAGVLENR